MAKHTDVYELCSLDEYDNEQAKVRSSLSWLIAKAHPRGAPERLQSLFLTDHDGVWYVRPAVIDSLVSCELYSAACNTLFGTSERRFRDFDAVLNYLRDCGIPVQYGEEELLAEVLRANARGPHEAAFDVYAHVTLCDCLMQAYANDLVKLDFVLDTICKYAPSGVDQSPPVATSFDEALVLWINNVCSQCDIELEKRAQLDSAFHYEVPQLTNVNDDLADGRALCLALFFYAPVGFIRLDDLALQRAPSLADSVHNLVSFLQTYENILRELTTASKRAESQSGTGSSSGSTPEGSRPGAFTDVISRLTTAQTELLRTFRCYLTIEDLLYSVRSVELNSIVFLLELFYVAECVLNGTTPPDAAPAAAMTGSAFVPALETVVEVDLEQTEPDIDINDSAHTHVSSEQQASNLSRDNGLDTSTETDSNAKENQRGDFVLDDDDAAQPGQFALDTTNRPLYRTYTKEHAKRSEAALADKRAESGHQLPNIDGHSTQQTQQHDNSASSSVAQPVESSSKGSNVPQPDSPSRITFGMLKRSPTPLLNSHNTVTPVVTPRMAPNSITDNVISPPPLLSPPVSSLKEQFLKSKLAKREQPLADASLKSSTHRDAASAQTVTWANLKRRSQPDLDAATGSLGRPIDPKPTLATSTSTWSDRMSRSAIGTTSISQTTMHVTTSASGSDLSLVTARRASPVRMASGGDSPSLSPCGPDLTALHLRFEQKKRAIETERARMLDDLTRQRHAVSNQAFVHVLNLRRARGSDLPPSGATISQQSPQQIASSTASAPAPAPASQRTHTTSLANVPTTHLADEQLRFLEKVDDDLTHYQAEIERLQRRSTAHTSPGVTNSLDSTTSVPASTPGVQQRERTTWQSPHRVDPEVLSQPDSYRSTATAERNTSMFFLNDTVNTHAPTSSTVSVSRGAQPQFNDTADTTSSQVVVQKTSLGNQPVVASSTLLQQNSTSVPQLDTAALSHPSRPPRSHGADPTTNAVAAAVVEPLQLSNGDVQHVSKPSARKVDDQWSSTSRSIIDDPDMPKPAWSGSNGAGARNELLSASSTARTDLHGLSFPKPNTNGESLLRTEIVASDDADLQNRMQLDEVTDPLEASGYSIDGLRPASNAVGFVIGEESISATDLEDRRRRRLLETAARRAEEAATRQRERETEAAARELARAQRADENERRKQAERARREAIFRDYVERKQSEATGPPYAVSNYAAHTAPSATRSARAVNPNAKQQQQQSAPEGPIKRASSVRRKATRDERAKSAFIVVNGDDDVDCEPVASNMTNSVERASTSASSSHTFEPLSAAQTSRTGRNTNANANANSANASAFARASSATRSFRAGASQRAGAFSLHPDSDLTLPGVNQHVLANADVNVNANTTSDGDPQTKLFVKPKSKSNRSVIMNAVAYACLAGSVNETQKRTVLDEIERSNASHFVILFRDSGSSQFKAVYEFDEERDCLTRLVGVGPRQLTSPMVEKFFKFNSGTKSFSEVTSTRHLSTVIDAITLFERYWQVLKKAAQPSNSSNSSVASPATADSAKAHSATSSRSIASAGAADRTTVPAMAHQSSANRAVAATGVRRGFSPAPPAVLAGSRPIRKQ